MSPRVRKRARPKKARTEFKRGEYPDYMMGADGRDPVFSLIEQAVKETGLSYAGVRDRANVSTSTLRAWLGKKRRTKRPQHATVMAVLRSCGIDLTKTKYK